MAEIGASKQNMERTIDKGAAQIRETSDRLNASTEETVKMFENSFASGVNAVKDYNLKAFEFTQATLQATFDNAKQLVSAKSPAEMLELWSKCASKQFEIFAEQAKELAALGQKVTTESFEPPHKAASLRP
jgi:phasin